MPLGSSLWLVPPPDLESDLARLTEDVFPAAFEHYCDPLPISAPHITLTSDIPDSTTDAPETERRTWFQSLPLLEDGETIPIIAIQSLQFGESVTRKIILLVQKEQSLVGLGSRLRAAAVEGSDDKGVVAGRKWAESTWEPHISLLYADVVLGPPGKALAAQLLQASGMIRPPGAEADPDDVAADEAKTSAWQKGVCWAGARLRWVDCRGPIQGWKVIAERTLDGNGTPDVALDTHTEPVGDVLDSPDQPDDDGPLLPIQGIRADGDEKN